MGTQGAGPGDASALIFPGQASQEVGMGSALRDASPAVESLFQLAEDVTGTPLRSLCAEGPLSELTRTSIAQVAVFVVSLAAAAHLDTAVKMLQRSGPVREIASEELSGVDTRPFGLDEPVVVATLSGPAGQPLTVRFGALNPEGFLQYMRIDGDSKVYLMSRFIGAEWMAALEGVTAR